MSFMCSMEKSKKDMISEITSMENSPSIEVGSPLYQESVSMTCLQLVSDLLHERGFNVATSLESTDRFVMAAMKSLVNGCSPKYTGTILLSCLCQSHPSLQVRNLDALSRGGIMSFNGETVQTELRHCKLATCCMLDGRRYTGSWVAGKMCGYGTLENANGVVMYKGHLQDNRPHGCNMCCCH